MENTNKRSTCSCPLNGGVCIDGIRDDFKSDANGRKIPCRWWQHLYGKDPQSETMIDQHDCAIAWLPITTIESSQMSRQTGASVDKVANVVNEVKQSIGGLGNAIRAASENIRQGVESGALRVMIAEPKDDRE